MSDEEIQKVEVRVNEKIRDNISLNEYRNLPIDEAKNMGAMALFGEKYGEFVRAIEFDRNYSIELCGGTHVKNTGEIGLFKLLSEGSVSAGIRRIEAVTNEKAWEFYNDKIAQLDAISSLLNGTKNALESVEKLIDENQKLKSEIEKFQLQQVAQVKDFLMGRIQSGICSFIAEKVDIPNAEAAKQLCFQLKQEHPNLVTVLVYEIDSKPGIAVYIDETLVESHGWNASQWVRDWGKHIQGGGGGQPFFATAGGKNAAGIEQVLDAAKQVLVGNR
jgi:alanyl-tRNA synthetase